MKRSVLLVFAVLFSQSIFAQREGLIIGQSCNIYFQRFGNGRPILVVGDPALPFRGCENVAQKLSKRNQVILYDPRGTGRTKLPRVDTSTVNYPRTAEDIESIRQVLRLPRLILLATPGGRGVVENYMRKFPEKIDGFIWLTGESWAPTTFVRTPKLDSLLAFSAIPNAVKPASSKPALRVDWTDTEAFYTTVDQFIRRNRLDYVAPEPKKARRPNGRGNIRRKRA
ncbi:MAG: alpha/beta hydrolase [Cytophagaceae bacterium]|nr:alpha/beta hydrolase [Cytophagaceae bacterium]